MQLRIQAIGLLLIELGVCTGALTAQASGPAHLTTITTTYAYNADGALTAVTQEVEGEETTTTYLTWDNFTPDTADPTTGILAAANGNLVGYGTSPGTTDLTTRFTFDSRDRLTAVSTNGRSISYAYHPTGLMASSTLSSAQDAFTFYYQNSKNAQVTNVYERATEKWSAYLGGARYLSDGTEQVLIKPRKDVAGTYDPEKEMLHTTLYGAYGAPRNAQGQVGEAPAKRGDDLRPAGPFPELDPHSQNAGLDLRDNPFLYAGEYRDPFWGGYYLRARWYDPAMPVFLSRDPVEHFSRYAYAGGNPVMNVDPSGRSFKSWAQNVAHTLDTPVGRIFGAALIDLFEFSADPKRFWHELGDQSAADQAYFWLNAVGSVALTLTPDSYFVGTAALGKFTTINLFEGVATTAQVTNDAAERGFKHFSWSSWLEGMGAMLVTQGEFSLWEANWVRTGRYAKFMKTTQRAGQGVRNALERTFGPSPSDDLVEYLAKSPSSELDSRAGQGHLPFGQSDIRANSSTNDGVSSSQALSARGHDRGGPTVGANQFGESLDHGTSPGPESSYTGQNRAGSPERGWGDGAPRRFAPTPKEELLDAD